MTVAASGTDRPEAVTALESLAAQAVRQRSGVDDVADLLLATRPRENPDDVALVGARTVAPVPREDVDHQGLS